MTVKEFDSVVRKPIITQKNKGWLLGIVLIAFTVFTVDVLRSNNSFDNFSLVPRKLSGDIEIPAETNASKMLDNALSQFNQFLSIHIPLKLLQDEED